MNAAVPLVSVLMPTYNHEKFVEESIRSVWAQTYANIELIVLNDGSSDGTRAVIDRLLPDSPIAMRAVHKQNEGLTRTLNQGLALARGQYIALCSGDDRYLPGHVETLMAAMQHCDAQTIVQGDGYIIDEHGERIGQHSAQRPYRSGDIYEDLLLFRTNLLGLSALFPAAAFEQVGGYNEASWLDDWEIYLRMTRSYRLHYVPVCVSEYRSHSAGQMTRQPDRLVPDILRIFEENIAEYARGRDWRWRRLAYASVYTQIGMIYYMNRRFADARPWLLRALRLRPWHRAAARGLLLSLLGERTIEKLSALRRRMVAPRMRAACAAAGAAHQEQA